PTQQPVPSIHEGIAKTGECIDDRRDPGKPCSQSAVQYRLYGHMVDDIGSDAPIQSYELGDGDHLSERIATPTDHLDRLKLESFSPDSLSVIGHTSRHDHIIPGF